MNTVVIQVLLAKLVVVAPVFHNPCQSVSHYDVASMIIVLYSSSFISLTNVCNFQFKSRSSSYSSDTGFHCTLNLNVETGQIVLLHYIGVTIRHEILLLIDLELRQYSSSLC